MPYLYDAASRSGEATLTSPTLADDLLETALKSCDTVYVILDGVDECEREQRKEISTVFKRIVDSSSVEEFDRVRCVFISQDDHTARRDYATLPSLKISVEDNREDITAYVQPRCNELERKFSLGNERTNELIRRITEESEGMCSFRTS